MHAGREVGLLVHALLERSALDEERPAPDSLRHATLEWLSATGSHLSEADMERALQLTLAFWRSPFAGGRPLAHAAREAPFFFAQGDTLITGVMDLMWQEGGVWHIVDYKTNALSGRPVAEAGRSLRIAGCCVLAGSAPRRGAGCAHGPSLPGASRRSPSLSVSTRMTMLTWRAMIDRALGDMRQATFPVRAGEDCSRCSVAEVCAHMARP